MNTRGAPAIAITGCLALAVELVNMGFDSSSAFDEFVTEKLGIARILFPVKISKLILSIHMRGVLRHLVSELTLRLSGNSQTNCSKYE